MSNLLNKVKELLRNAEYVPGGQGKDKDGDSKPE